MTEYKMPEAILVTPLASIAAFTVVFEIFGNVLKNGWWFSGENLL